MSDGYEVIIESRKQDDNYWRDLWRFRELFYFLAWRDILVRYKQTTIGIAWGILRPVLTMIAFSLVFGKLANLPSGNIPYPVLVFTAIVPWHFFASAVTDGSNSLVDNANMLTKVYFPRIIVPISTVMVALVDLLISLIILVVLMGWYHVVPSWKIMTLPIFFGQVLLSTLGFSLLLSALNVKYRDFRFVIPFILQIALYISPVGFSSSAVPGTWRLMYSMNPMVGVIDGFRWALLGEPVRFYWPGYFLSLTITVLVFLVGLFYFQRTERYYADII